MCPCVCITAAAARADGIQFVSIGVGNSVDPVFLGSLGEYYAGDTHTLNTQHVDSLTAQA